MSNDQQTNTIDQQNIDQTSQQIVEELNEIRKLLLARQVNAALARIEEAQRKFPNSLEILSAKLHILRSAGNEQLALDIAKSLFKDHPNHPVAVGEYIKSTAFCGYSKEAVDTLVNYCEKSNDEMQKYIVNTAFELAYLLLLHGEAGAATGITTFINQFNEYQEKADYLTSIINSSTEIPLIVRTFVFDFNCPDDFPAKKEFDNVVMLIARLKWKEALNLLKSMSNYASQWPSILKNIAVLHYWLIDAGATSNILKTYAALPNLTPEQSAESEALRLTLNLDLLGKPTPVLLVEYKVSDANIALEKLLSSPNFSSLPFDPKTFVQQNFVPPKGIFRIFNRPTPPIDEEITINNIQTQIAIGMLFGKETDKEARIEISELYDSEQKTVENLLKQILGEVLITNLSKTQTVKYKTRSYDIIAPQFVFPANRTYNAEQQTKLYEQYYSDTVAAKWLNTTFESLSNKTPTEAVKDQSYKNRVLGLLILLEITMLESLGELGFNFINQLRNKLGFPLLDIIQIQAETDEDQIAFIDKIPLWRWYLLDIKKLSNQVIVEGFFIINMYNYLQCSTRFAQEILNRPLNLIDPQARILAYDNLIKFKRANNELEEALTLIDKAKNEAVLNNTVDAIWYMHEIPVRLLLNQVGHIEDAIKYVVNKYGKDEKIMKEFYSLLLNLGLIPQNPTNKPEQTTENKTPEIWTPDNQNNNSQNEQTKPKLWTPD
ncbi:MAG: hypothetical protein LBP59_05635 [Planctomycetaceae bacterium]|jgi:hypothetical protein|nr:hypothetical protein [Planctomycetaceae bacterium]